MLTSGTGRRRNGEAGPRMHDHGVLLDGLAVLLAAILLVPLFARLKLSPILGYLAAGMAIGPFGLGLISDTQEIRLLAEFGVLFLLFMIGLELPIERLKALRRYVFGLGGAQVLITGAAIAGACLAVFDMAVEGAIVLGFGLALSSTATVLQLLSERGELIQRHGRVSLAILLFQDLAVAPLLALIPLLALPDGNLLAMLGLAAVKAAAALVVIVLIGRYVLRPFYRAVVAHGGPELFTATALFIVLGTSLITAEAGMSMALGAFLAGMLLADTEFRHQVEIDIQPFRGLFLGLFFMTVGMGVDARILIEEMALIGALLVALLTLKTVVILALGAVFGLGRAVTFRAAFALAQGGEFAFVLLGLATLEGVVDARAAQIAFLVVGLSIVATPLMMLLGRRLAARVGGAARPHEAELGAEAEDLRDHVVIAGFGRVGQQLAAILSEKGLAYVALERDSALVANARRAGLPVYFGDASHPDILEAARVDHARACVITLQRGGGEERLIAVMRARHPDLPIFTRAHDWEHSRALDAAGASGVVEETGEVSLRLAARVLRSYGTGTEAVRETTARLRERDYEALRELAEAHLSPRKGP